MQINPNTSEAYKLLHRGVLALSRAEQQGIRIDVEYCNQAKAELTERISQLEKNLYDTNFYRHWSHSIGNKKPNIYSNSQLSNYLYKTKKIEPVFTTKSGQGSTDEEALTQLNIPELNDMLIIRKLKKIRDTYLEAFTREQVNGVIHPNFNLHLVQTFRSSSDSPNFQNISKRDKEAMKIIRSAIRPRPGHQLAEIDYSGVEFRIAGCYYQDPTMLKYIQNNSDIHEDIAAKVMQIDNFNKRDPIHAFFRSAAKNGFVFPQLYGSWYKRCAVNIACEWGGLLEKKNWKANQGTKLADGYFSDYLLEKGINNIEKFQKHVQSVEDYYWNDIFTTGKKYQKKIWSSYQKKGYIDSFTGFRYSGLMTLNQILNYPIQGSAFHCLLWSFIELDRQIIERQWDSRLNGQIHDALNCDLLPEETKKFTALARRITCIELPKAFTWINVPLDVEIDIGKVDASWAEMEKMEEN
jgi:DNA polymerase I-like protein with 3'-5' exonuclease and polymerase domains